MKKCLMVILFLLISIPMSAQTIKFQGTEFSIGFGSFFDRASVTFSKKAMYGVLQWHGVGFPALKEGTSTGIAIEGHPSTLLSKTTDGVRLQSLEAVDYRVWSISRVPISALPIARLQSGALSHMFSGVDALLAEGGPDDFTGDFDVRIVMGGHFGKIGPGKITVELYMFQDNVPVSFVISYGF